MVKSFDQRLRLALWLSIVGLTVLRLGVSPFTQLIPEEAYYWTYAKHPSLGYYDHPPMVAWTVELGTLIFGNNEFGVRFINIVLWVFSCLLLVKTARLWFEERAAMVAGLLYVLFPIFIFTGFIVTPDGPLIFFWLLTLYAVSQGLQTRRAIYWLLAGMAFGGALLSKYYALLLAPSLLWFLIWSPKYRSWLKRPEPWLAVLVALAVFSPVIIWNSQHEWASFAYQTTRTVGQKGAIPRRLSIFWGLQFVVATPIGLALLGMAAWESIRRGWFQHEDRWNFAASFGLPLFCLFVAASFKTDVHINWTCPAFLALLPAGAALWLKGIDAESEKIRRRWRWAGWALAGISAMIVLVVHVSLATGEPETLAYSHANGWRELGDAVRVAVRNHQDRTGQRPFLIGADKYNLAAEMGFYLHDPNECLNGYAFGARGLGYRYWADLEKFRGRPALIILWGPKPAIMEDLRDHFDKLDPPQSVEFDDPGKNWKNVQMVTGYGYHPGPPSAKPDASLD